MGHMTEVKELLAQERTNMDLTKLNNAFERMTNLALEWLPAGPEIQKYLEARDDVAAWISKAAKEVDPFNPEELEERERK